MRDFKVLAIKAVCCLGVALSLLGLTACGGGGSGDTTSSSGGTPVTSSSISLPTSVEVVSAK